MEWSSKLNLLASHNGDILRLLEKGYALSFEDGYLIVRDIPYLDSAQQLLTGAIVTKVIDLDGNRIKLEDHQIFFCGSHPCELSGIPVANLGGGSVTLHLTSQDIIVERSFSNKPAEDFVDFFEKIEHYVTLFSGPAMSLHDTTPYTFRLVDTIADPVFKHNDTLTSRAQIGDLAAKFSEEVVAIIGLGGTGSYLLDFLVKTRVKGIRAFDHDDFHVHNAYRSPGKNSHEEFGKKKADIYRDRYGDFREGLDIVPEYIHLDSKNKLEGITFAFVCVDKGSARKEILDLLIGLNIPFIDVGMGLDRQNGGPISGTLRTVYASPETAEDILAQKIIPLTDFDDDEYRTNIQIAELNALNASLAIIRYKQLKGFYVDDSSFRHLLFTLDSFQSVGE